MTKKCVICGSEFETESAKSLICANVECKRMRQKLYREEHKKNRCYQFESYRAPERKRTKRKKPLSISEVGKLAREAGMSYGQYVGQLYLKGISI